MLLPLSQGQPDKTQPLLTHTATAALTSLFCSDAHDEHGPDKYSRSIGCCTIPKEQINAEQCHALHRYAKVCRAQPLLQLRFCICFKFYFVVQLIAFSQMMHLDCQKLFGSRKRNYSSIA